MVQGLSSKQQNLNPLHNMCCSCVFQYDICIASIISICFAILIDMCTQLQFLQFELHLFCFVCRQFLIAVGKFCKDQVQFHKEISHVALGSYCLLILASCCHFSFTELHVFTNFPALRSTWYPFFYLQLTVVATFF